MGGAARDGRCEACGYPWGYCVKLINKQLVMFSAWGTMLAGEEG